MTLRKTFSFLLLFALASLFSLSGLNAQETQVTQLELTQEERQWVADHPVIRVHNEIDWPPFNYFERGKPKGFSIDYMNLLAKQIGIKVNYISGPTWNEFMGMIKAGELDVMLNIAKTGAREEFLLFTEPYAYNANSILSRKNAPYSTLKQLYGKTVALPKGFFYAEVLNKDHPLINILLVKNVREGLRAVAFGQADATFGKLTVFNDIKAQEMMTGLVISGEIKMGDRKYSQLNIATHKNLPILASILRKAVTHVPQNELKRLRQRWVNVTTLTQLKNSNISLTNTEKDWLDNHKYIRLGVDPGYPPFDFIAEDGTYAGMASDYARLVGDRLGITLEVVPGLSWSQVIEGVKNRNLDVLPAVTQTPERDEYMNFSDVHLNFPDVIFMRTDHPLIAGLADLQGRTLALVEGYATTEFIRTNYPTIKIILNETLLDAFKAVAEGEADASVQNLGVATYFINKHDITNLVVAAPANLNMPGLSFGVRKDWPELVPIIDKALATITPQEEAAIRKKWGASQYQIGLNAATVRKVALQAGGTGAVIFIIFIIWNRRLAKEVKLRKQAEAQLQYEVDVKNRFFSIIAHDLKGPFTVLLGMTQVMAEMPDKISKHKLADYAGKVNDSGLKFFDLLQNLLEWSRLQMTGQKINASTFSLRKASQTCVDILCPIALDKDITLTNTIGKEMAFADPDMVQTVIRNLIGNALKFTPVGGTIDLSSHAQNDMVQITVADNGVGISEQHLANIFALDLRTSTPGTDGETGTGLGLPLCKEMIEKNGGTIRIESTPGQGSKFHFTLPIRQISEMS